jgi:hypothetical protein
MGKLEVELAYNATPAIKDREYFQSFVPDRNLTQVPGRVVNPSATVVLLNALVGHEDKDRLMRAISQYSQALENWSPGSEVLCVAHLFMGIEALKPVALKHHLSQNGITKTALGELWAYRQDGRETLDQFLDHEARKKLIFENDTVCHRKAKYVSDNFEHGFENFANLRPDAKVVVVRTAKFLRAAIFRLLKINTEVSRVLLSSPFESPRGPLKLVKYIWGRLLADTETLAPEGQEYPIIHWKTSLTSVSRNEHGVYSFSPTENFTARLGEGVSFKPEAFEVWDGCSLQELPRPTIR